MVRNLTEALRFVVFRLTQITQISQIFFWWWKISRRMVVWCGGVVWLLRVLWVLRFIKAHTDSTRFNKIIICEKFVLICSWFKKPRITRIFFLLNPCDYSCWILLNLCEGFLFVEGEWRVIFCVNGVGDFDVPWFFCIFVIIKLSQAWMRLY